MPLQSRYMYIHCTYEQAACSTTPVGPVCRGFVALACSRHGTCRLFVSSPRQAKEQLLQSTLDNISRHRSEQNRQASLRCGRSWCIYIYVAIAIQLSIFMHSGCAGCVVSRSLPLALHAETRSRGRCLVGSTRASKTESCLTCSSGWRPGGRVRWQLDTDKLPLGGNLHAWSHRLHPPPLTPHTPCLVPRAQSVKSCSSSHQCRHQAAMLRNPQER